MLEEDGAGVASVAVEDEEEEGEDDGSSPFSSFFSSSFALMSFSASSIGEQERVRVMASDMLAASRKRVVFMACSPILRGIKE
jgi:hypothetical protein